MPALMVNNAKLNYTQVSYKGEGEAQDLVMVHGLAANMAFWLHDYAHHFAKRFRVTLFDLRGHGRSEITQVGYTPQGIGSDIKALMDALEIEQAHIIAHSFGGVGALNLVQAHSDSVKSLILADTQITRGRQIAQNMQSETAEALQKTFAEYGIMLKGSDPFFGYHLITEVARLRMREEEIPEAIRPWIKRLFDGNSQRAAKRWLDLVDNTDAMVEFKSDDTIRAQHNHKYAKVPVLGVYGEVSHSMATAQYLSGWLPRAEWMGIRGAGHFFPKAYGDSVKAMCDAFWDGSSLEKIAHQDEHVEYLSFNESLPYVAA